LALEGLGGQVLGLEGCGLDSNSAGGTELEGAERQWKT